MVGRLFGWIRSRKKQTSPPTVALIFWGRLSLEESEQISFSEIITPGVWAKFCCLPSPTSRLMENPREDMDPGWRARIGSADEMVERLLAPRCIKLV